MSARGAVWKMRAITEKKHIALRQWSTPRVWIELIRRPKLLWCKKVQCDVILQTSPLSCNSLGWELMKTLFLQSVTCVWKITAGCLKACGVICTEAMENYSRIRDTLQASLATCVNTTALQTAKCSYIQQQCGGVITLFWRIKDGMETCRLHIGISHHLIIPYCCTAVGQQVRWMIIND